MFKKARLKPFCFLQFKFRESAFSTFCVRLTCASKQKHFFHCSNFRENGQKSQKMQNFLPLKFSPCKVNIISRMRVIIFLIKAESYYWKNKSIKSEIIKYKTYTETAFE